MFPKNLGPSCISIIFVITTFLSLTAFVAGDEKKTIQCYCQSDIGQKIPDCKDGKMECPTDDKEIKGHCLKQIIEMTSPQKKTLVEKHCGAEAYGDKCEEPRPLKGNDTAGTQQICNCKGNLCNHSTIISSLKTPWLISLAGFSLVLCSFGTNNEQ